MYLHNLVEIVISATCLKREVCTPSIRATKYNVSILNIILFLQVMLQFFDIFICLFFWHYIPACKTRLTHSRHICVRWQLSALLLSPCKLVIWAVTSRTAYAHEEHVKSYKEHKSQILVIVLFLSYAFDLKSMLKNHVRKLVFIYFILSLKVFMAHIWQRTNFCASHLLVFYDAEHWTLRGSSWWCRHTVKNAYGLHSCPMFHFETAVKPQQMCFSSHTHSFPVLFPLVHLGGHIACNGGIPDISNQQAMRALNRPVSQFVLKAFDVRGVCLW